MYVRMYVFSHYCVTATKVFGWCADAATSSIGAEYVLMERVPGVTLDSIWVTRIHARLYMHAYKYIHTYIHIQTYC